MPDSDEKGDRWTVRDVVLWTADYFAGRGVESARLDAEVLLCSVLNLDRLTLYLNFERPLMEEERARFREMVQRRGRREPVAYITREKEFWSLPMRVRPGVLIPRPDTETLVSVALATIEDIQSPSVLEIGAGSGAISIAIAHERADARVTATDIEPIALETTAYNAERTGVKDRVEVVRADLFESLPTDNRYHLICSNPPYIPSDVIPTLEPEIAQYEPRRALDGGPDGLDVIRRIARDAKRFLLERGSLIIEIGDDQAAAVHRILRNEGGFEEIIVHTDLAHKERVIKGTP